MKQPSLSELQLWFRKVMTDPRPTETCMKDKQLARFAASNSIRSTPELDAAERMNIYSQGYFLRLRDALAEDFEAVQKSLGKTEFDRVTRDYLAYNPSRSPTLGEAGRWFPDFLDRHPVSTKNPWLPQLARLEWAVVEAFFAREIPAGDFQKLARWSPEEWASARAVLDPSVKLFKMSWPTLKFWQLRNEKTSVKRPTQAAAEYLIVLRDDKWVNVHSLDPVEFELLRLLDQGLTLGTIAQRAESAGLDTDGIDLSQTFMNFRERGYLRDLTTEQNFGQILVR